MTNSPKIIGVINGPNLNLLGTREPEIYGTETLQQIIEKLTESAKKLGIAIVSYQSNIEGELIRAAQDSLASKHQGIIINPGAYGHTSVALRDALVATGLPVLEVHLSNVYKREPFRHHSHITPVVRGMVMGLGGFGYILALEALHKLIDWR